MSMTAKKADLRYCKEQAVLAYQNGDYERGEYYENEAARLEKEVA